MSLQQLLRAAAIAAVGIGATVQFASASTVADGDFTVPSGAPSFVTYNSGSAMGPWTVTGAGDGAGVDLIGGYWQAPPAGGGSVDLDGNAPGGISQSLGNLSGLFTLSFYLSGNPDGQPTVKSLNVSVGNVSNQTFTFDTSGINKDNMNWLLETINFTASGLTTLSFTSNTPYCSPTGCAFGAVIGDISVVDPIATPLPATWTMLIAAFVGFGFLAHRSAKKGSVALAAA